MNRDSSDERAVRPLRDRFKEEIARAIMNAAEEVFAEQGLYAAHMNEIAARAGVAVGTLYNHYKDREALLQGILESRRGELLARMDAALAQSDGQPFATQLRGFVLLLLSHCEAHRRFFAILMQGEHPQSSLHKPSESLRELNLRVEQLLQRGLAQGALRPEHQHLHATFLMGLWKAIFLRDLANQGKAAAQ